MRDNSNNGVTDSIKSFWNDHSKDIVAVSAYAAFTAVNACVAYSSFKITKALLGTFVDNSTALTTASAVCSLTSVMSTFACTAFADKCYKIYDNKTAKYRATRGLPEAVRNFFVVEEPKLWDAANSTLKEIKDKPMDFLNSTVFAHKAFKDLVVDKAEGLGIR